MKAKVAVFPPFPFLGALFSFLYLKKIKISKIYVHFEKFQKYPRLPSIGRQALVVIFFFKFATRSMAGKKNERGPVAPPTGDRPPVAPPQATTGPHPQARLGACRPPSGDGVLPPYISILPPFPPHLSPKIPQKIQKKREG